MNRFVIKMNRIKLLGIVFFMFAIISKGFVDAVIVKANPYSPFNYVKYILLILSTCCFFVLKRNKMYFRKECRALLFCYFLIFLISVYFSIYNTHFTFRTFKEMFFILVPIIFAYYALNALTLKEISSIAKLSVIVFACSYFIEISSAFTLSGAIQAIKNFSLLGGQASFAYDALESSAFPDAMMSLFCFFTYFNKGNKKWMWISYICILLMNKRFIVLFSTMLMIMVYLPYFKRIFNMTVNKRLYWIPVIIFTISPLIICLLTNPVVESTILYKYDFNLQDFWMGRDKMLQYYIANHFSSYGLGSTFDFRGKLLELESVKFYLETTLVGSFLISFTYWRIVRKNFFTLILMLYIFVNMNTSTSIITGAFAWVFYFILIGVVNRDERIN